MSIVVGSLGSVITVADIINAALRLLQVNNPDTALTNDEVHDGLEAINMMIDGWSNESLMLHHISKETFQTIAGQASYTIGYSAQFNTARPISIEAMTVNISTTDWPVKQLAFDDYAMIRLKTLQSNYPQYFYVDEGADLSTIYLYPVPVSPAPLITLYMRKPLPTFTSAFEEIILPKGYLRALKYNLAVELAPEYQTDPGQVVTRTAITSKADLKRTNVRAITTQTDLVPLSSTRPRYNIYSDR
jgi:hypothetical protein